MTVTISRGSYPPFQFGSGGSTNSAANAFGASAWTLWQTNSLPANGSYGFAPVGTSVQADIEFDLVGCGNANPNPNPNCTPGLTATLYNNIDLSGNPAVTRTDNNIDFNWGNSSPSAGINSDNISIRWQANLQVPTTGNYRFQTNTDDGVRLFVNNDLVINEYYNQDGQASRTSGNIFLTAGQQVPITMEYNEASGSALARLAWATPTNGNFVVIASESFCTVPPSPPPTSTSVPPGDFNYGCEDGRFLEAYGTNINCSANPDASVTIPSPNNTTQTIVEVVYKNSYPGNTITVQGSNGINYTINQVKHYWNFRKRICLPGPTSRGARRSYSQQRNWKLRKQQWITVPSCLCGA
ncbi:MAG: hypothetical protein HC821_02820 [Lewinella sp.]|nr:hypothetical protein [Lewinella sp.]